MLRSRGRVSPSLALLALLLVPAALAGDYRMTGVTPDRTGVLDGPGPEWDDVAWTASLGAPRAYASPPITLGDVAYILTGEPAGLSFDPPEPGRAELNRIIAIPLDTGVPKLLLPLPQGPTGWTTDGERFFVLAGPVFTNTTPFRFVDGGGVHAYDVATGALLWRWIPHLPGVESRAEQFTYCVFPAIQDGIVYISCDLYDFITGNNDPARPIAAALDAATGEQLWMWVRDPAAELTGGAPLPVALPGSTATLAVTMGVSLAGDRALVTTLDATARSGFGVVQVWALDTRTGGLAWSVETGNQSTTAIERQLAGHPLFDAPALPLGSATLAFLKHGETVRALNAALGTEVWSMKIGAEDSIRAGTGSGMSTDGTTLYATSFQSLYALDIETRALRWQVRLPPTGEQWANHVPLIGGSGRIYARSSFVDYETSTVNTSYLHALDARDGEVLWRHAFEGPVVSAASAPAHDFAVADDIMIVAGADGNVTALGRTRASIAPRATLATAYPALGEPLTLDASSSAPGMLGATTGYRVDWGDGNTSDWQDSPVFTHGYDAAADTSITLHARNDAGQTSRILIDVHPGMPPPPAPPTLLAKIFSRENQDATFFLLGGIGTLLVGGFGVMRSRRKRSLLRAELKAVEEAHARTRDDPTRGEVALAARRARIESLAATGRLDDAQAVTIYARIDALEAALRTRAVRDSAGVPPALALLLDRALADSRVTPAERAALAEAIERDPSLLPEQRRALREKLGGA